MQSIVTAAWLSSARPKIAVTLGDLEWWICLGGPQVDWAERIRIWTQGDEPVSWGWFNPPDSLELFVEPGLSETFDTKIRDEILEWGIERIAAHQAGTGVIQIWAADAWPEADFLVRRNFIRGGQALTQFWQRLDRDLPNPSLPVGYKVRTMKGPDEVPARVEVHRSAFAPSKMTIEKYKILTRLPHYSFERDVVVTAPDGSFAAFTLCWFDPIGGVGEFEPVGTHPDHRGLGLGKAANASGLRLLRELGARDCIVFSDRDNTASEPLYASAGFEELAVHRKYTRQLAPSAEM